MKIIIGFFIFCLVLFVYLHIQFHLKTSEDLEIYEVDQPSKIKLEEILDLRQPLLFDFDCQKIMEVSNKSYLANHYEAFELKIRNINEEDSIRLAMNASIKLFQQDKAAHYFSENNMEFLEETSIIKDLKYNDELLRPYMVSNCNYDIMMGSVNTCTPFRYELNYRNFFLLTQGTAKIKLASPHCSKYLHTIYDYENFEFKSPIDPWNLLRQGLSRSLKTGLPFPLPIPIWGSPSGGVSSTLSRSSRRGQRPTWACGANSLRPSQRSF